MIQPFWLRTRYEQEVEIRRLYHGEGLSQTEVAMRMGIDQSTVCHLMRRYGIKARSRIKVISAFGPESPHYRTGKTYDGNGYVVLSSKSHGREQGRREHQVIAEKKIGRELRPDEVVHHLNGDKADNRPDNLQVVTRKDHARLHLGKGRLHACRSCGSEKWYSPSAASRLGAKGYACLPCGGRWA